MVAEKWFISDGYGVKYTPIPGPLAKWWALHPREPWHCPLCTHVHNKSYFLVRKKRSKVGDFPQQGLSSSQWLHSEREISLTQGPWVVASHTGHYLLLSPHFHGGSGIWLRFNCGLSSRNLPRLQAGCPPSTTHWGCSQPRLS